MTGQDAAYETLLLAEAADGVVVLTLNRPERANAMTPVMFDELIHAGLALDSRDGLRAVIVTGAGAHFCAGMDLGDVAQFPVMGPLEMFGLQERGGRAALAIRSMRVPVIAAVNGSAAGGGLALALAADIRLAGPAAKFNAAFTRIGLSAGDLGTSWLLTRLIGPGRASEICFTGRQVHAAEATAIGLANAVSAEGELMTDALALAAAITANSPGGVQMSKRALQANLEAASYAAALELENRGQALLTRTADMPEALAAFREKRPAQFTGQ